MTSKPGVSNIRPGVVIGTRLPGQVVEVRLEGDGEVVRCVWAAGIMCGLLGFRLSHVPTINTRVLVLHSGMEHDFIVGTLPALIVDGVQPDRKLTGEGAADYTTTAPFTSRQDPNETGYTDHRPPVDLVEGEIDLSNLQGVGLSLLRHMASLQAGDLARVECHLHDDLVRIISDAFKHYTAFGEHSITNDGGRLNVVWHGTSREHEAMGRMRETDPLVKLKDGDTVDQTDVDPEKDDGRWRFSQYVGWLGNFVNMFVTDPVNQIGKLAEDAFRSGKARVHVGNDGAILLQSVSDIVLEKVVRIPVPVPLRREDSADGNRTDDPAANYDFLKAWQPSDQGNVFEMAFQLREYARWLSATHSLARFRQLNREWRVPTELQTPAPSLSADETDRRQANLPTASASVAAWRLAYSAIRIFRDGSIQTVDAYGNSITSTKTGVLFDTPRDFTFVAGGSFNVLAARDINLVAQKDVGITAAKGAIRVKAETALQMFVKAGHAVIETTGTYLLKLIGAFKIGTRMDVSKEGDMILRGTLHAATAYVQGDVIARYMAHATPMAGPYNHYNHVGIAGPPPMPVGQVVQDEFKFPTSHPGESLYEPYGQQMLRRGELGGTTAWNLLDNAVEGKGAPWPGSRLWKQADGGTSLNTPSTDPAPAAKPQPLTSVPVVVRSPT